MDRRTFIAQAGAVAAAGLIPIGDAKAQGESLEALLAQLDADPALVEDGWQYRTKDISRGVGTGKPSSRQISARANDMIVRFEVASKQRYEKLYARPIWPKGASGVTIGIGYDLRFPNKAMLERDWGRLLDQRMMALLTSVLRLGGTRARDALPSVQEVIVPWQQAETQFRAFLPYAVAQTEAVFPNSARLSDDSMGALVSLVYNRGPSVNRDSDSRREMRQIRELMMAQNFAPIPAQIRSMKRIWQAKPDARGLLIRREAEAVLFEQGLA